MERPCTLLVEVGLFLSGRTGAETSGSVVGEGAPDPRTGKKGECCVGDLVPIRVV